MTAIVRSASPQPAETQGYLQYQRGLLNLHRLTGISPSVKVLNGEVTKVGDLAIAGGTYSDIWIGAWLGEKKVIHRCTHPYIIAKYSRVGCSQSPP
jgi:hypothetical protein